MGGPDLALHRLAHIPRVAAGDDLHRLISAALDAQSLALQPGDILVLAQKIVSKAEGRSVDLATVTVSPRARRLAESTGKDPRVVELILQESTRILRERPGLIIAEHRSGIVLANAGIDRSNVSGGEDTVLLLPADSDASARRLRESFQTQCGVAPGVLVIDSVGRPWRLGTTGLCIGAAGVEVLRDLRGEQDLFGRELQVAEISPADSLAAAAALLMGEGAEGTPVVLIRGLADSGSRQPASAVLRPAGEDLFR